MKINKLNINNILYNLRYQKAYPIQVINEEVDSIDIILLNNQIFFSLSTFEVKKKKVKTAVSTIITYNKLFKHTEEISYILKNYPTFLQRLSNKNLWINNILNSIHGIASMDIIAYVLKRKKNFFICSCYGLKTYLPITNLISKIRKNFLTKTQPVESSHQTLRNIKKLTFVSVNKLFFSKFLFILKQKDMINLRKKQTWKKKYTKRSLPLWFNV